VAGADIVAVNKVDLVDDVVKEKVADIIREISPNSRIAFISAKTGEGVDQLVQMLGGSS
jgi:Ni2+-binding GTPase involved in maturation of urease and hydrogenase